MFSIDYPHSVTLWPESVEHIADLTEGMDPVSRRRCLSGNAIASTGSTRDGICGSTDRLDADCRREY